MKVCAILILFAFLFASINGAPFLWNGSAGDNNFNNANNWTPNGVPGSSDNATISLGTTVTITSSISISNLMITAPGYTLIVSNGATLSFVNDFITTDTLTIQVGQGSSLIATAAYVTFNGAVNFINFGTVSINPIFTAGATITNVQNGNPVNFSGQKINVFFGSITIPVGFQFDPTQRQSFQAVAPSTITFQYTENINTNGWLILNSAAPVCNFIFQQGLNVNGAFMISSNTVGLPRPSVTLGGTISINSAQSWDATPTFGTGGATILNGNTLTINSQSVTFNTPTLSGTGTLSFSNSLGVNLVTSFSQPITFYTASPTWNQQWQLSGSTATFTTATTWGFNLQLVSNVVFQNSFTFGSGFTLQVGGSGTFTFTNLVTLTTGSLDLLTHSVVAVCTQPANAFSFAGSAFTFTSGLTVRGGCTVTSGNTMTITGSLTTDSGNTTMPAFNFFNGPFFFQTAGTPPANSLFGITLFGNQNVPNGITWTANNVEVILNAGSILTLGDNSVLADVGNGLFTLNGNLMIGSGVSITTELAFGSGSYSISTVNRCDWRGELLLRNTILGGTGEIWFYGTLQVIKGQSNITNPNFRLKGGLATAYLWDGINPNLGATLVINSNGVTSNRIVENSVTAAAGVNVVFDDQITFNVSSTVTGSTGIKGTPPGCVTFRTSGLTQNNINTNAVVTFQTFIYFNHTNLHLQGTGSYIFNNNPTFWLSGGLNFPAATGDAVANVNSPATVSCFVSSTIGTTILFNSDMATDDLDGNNLVASQTLTLASSATQLRTVGTITTLCNVIFGGNVLLTSAVPVNDAGTTTIQGNSVLLSANPTWNNNVNFAGGVTTISTQGSAQTFTLGDQTPYHGLTLTNSLIVNSPATLVLNGIVSVSFPTGAGFSGTGIINAQNTLLNAAGTGSNVLSPQTLILNNATFVGVAQFTLSPADNALQGSNGIQATVPVTYTGTTLTLSSALTISPLVSFSANPITIQGGFTLTVANGPALSIATNWINNANIVFNSPLTITNTGVLTGSGALTFNNTLTLTQNVTLSQAVTFGFNNAYVFAIQNTGFSLILTGSTVTVLGVVIPSGTIVSTSPSNNLQVISGGGVINSAWTWTNPVTFGTLNITGTRTLNFNLYVQGGQTACFVNGIILNTGTFLADTTPGTPTLLIEPFLENDGNNVLGTALTLRLTRGTTGIFELRGTVPPVINSTVSCEAQLQFTQNVTFGWVTPTSSNSFTMMTFCTNWFNANNPNAVVQIWRNTLVINSDTNVVVYPQIIFGMNNTSPVSINAITGGGLLFLGNLTIFGSAFTTSANVALGAISITTLQNSTLSNLLLTAPLTFISTTTPWVEPTVTFNGGLSQTLILVGPIKLDNPTLNSGSGFQAAPPSRLAITSGFTATSSFTFNVPVQFYVNTQGQWFVVTLSNFGTVVNLRYTPSFFNPLFLVTNSPLNFRVSGNTALNNRFYFQANSSYTLGNIDVPGGVLQLSNNTQGLTATATFITIGGSGATFWVDGIQVNAQTATFTDGAPGSIFQITINGLNAASSPNLNVQTAYYRGSAALTVPNGGNWDGTAVNGIVAVRSFQTNSVPFPFTSGTPGYQYTSSLSGYNAQFSRSVAPTLSPFPTNSNGPSPAVSSSSALSFAASLLAAILLFAF
jgi:fibronectin-binding autotransporter adhesin